MRYINLIASLLFLALYFIVNDFEKLESLYLAVSLVYFLAYQIEMIILNQK